MKDWEKKFTVHVTDKGFIIRVYEEFLQLNDRKTNNPLQKYAKFLNKLFIKKRYVNGQQIYKKVFNIIVRRDMQTEKTLRYFTIKIAKNKKEKWTI